MVTKLKKNVIIIIGSNRCGTTSLYNYLKVHPNITASRIKMTGYFLDKNYPKADYRIAHYYDDGKDFFKSYFNQSNSNTFLEASPDYMYSKGTLKRLIDFKKENKVNLKLIVLIRDPRERFYSLFYHLKKLDRLDETISLEEFLNLQTNNYEDDLVKSSLEMGFYHKYLGKYVETFTADELFICPFEKLALEPKATVSDLCKWIGISPTIYESDFNFVKHNQGLRQTKTKAQKNYIYWRKKMFSFIMERPWLFNIIKPIAKLVSNKLFNPNVDNIKDNNWKSSQTYLLLSKKYEDEAVQLGKLFPTLKLMWHE